MDQAPMKWTRADKIAYAIAILIIIWAALDMREKTVAGDPECEQHGAC